MANIKQQKKRVRTNEERRQRNVSVRSRMKTMVKKADAALASGDAEAVKKTLPEALSAIDRAAAKGIIHANSASRKKSSLMIRANAGQQ